MVKELETELKRLKNELLEEDHCMVNVSQYCSKHIEYFKIKDYKIVNNEIIPILVSDRLIYDFDKYSRTDDSYYTFKHGNGGDMWDESEFTIKLKNLTKKTIKQHITDLKRAKQIKAQEKHIIATKKLIDEIFEIDPIKCHNTSPCNPLNSGNFDSQEKYIEVIKKYLDIKLEEIKLLINLN